MSEFGHPPHSSTSAAKGFSWMWSNLRILCAHHAHFWFVCMSNNLLCCIKQTNPCHRFPSLLACPFSNVFNHSQSFEHPMRAPRSLSLLSISNLFLISTTIQYLPSISITFNMSVFLFVSVFVHTCCLGHQHIGQTCLKRISNAFETWTHR